MMKSTLYLQIKKAEKYQSTKTDALGSHLELIYIDCRTAVCPGSHIDRPYSTLFSITQVKLNLNEISATKISVESK